MLHVSIGLPVRRGRASVQSSIEGGGAETPDFFPFSRQAGRFLDVGEVREADRSAVLSSALADDLFGKQPAVGEEVLIKDQRFSVVGVVRPPRDEDGAEQRICYVPYRAAIERLGANPLDAQLLL